MKEFFRSNNIVLLKADKSNEAPEVDALLRELGNSLTAIPYYGLFQPSAEPIHFDGVYFTPESFLNQLGAQQLAEAWGQPKERPIHQKQSKREVHLPDAVAN